MIALSILSLFCPFTVLFLLFIGDSNKTNVSQKQLIFYSGISGLIVGYAFSPILYNGSFFTSLIVSLYQVLAVFGIIHIYKTLRKQ